MSRFMEVVMGRNKDRTDSDKHEFVSTYLNRYLCDVLDDMRKCDKTKNYAMLVGLIEEAQILASRMESGLADHKDLLKLNVEMTKAKRAYKALEKEYDALHTKVAKSKPKPKKKAKN